MKIETLPREFKFTKNGKEIILPDPNPAFTPEEVRKFYSSQHGELTNSNVNGPSIEDDKKIYSFGTKVGTKG